MFDKFWPALIDAGCMKVSFIFDHLTVNVVLVGCFLCWTSVKQAYRSACTSLAISGGATRLFARGFWLLMGEIVCKESAAPKTSLWDFFWWHSGCHSLTQLIWETPVVNYLQSCFKLKSLPLKKKLLQVSSMNHSAIDLGLHMLFGNQSVCLCDWGLSFSCFEWILRPVSQSSLY